MALCGVVWCGAQSVRLHNDLIFTVLFAVFAFALHSSALFTSTSIPAFVRWALREALLFGAIGMGFLNHYLLPQLRSEMPFLFFAGPILATRERALFEVTRMRALHIS